MVFVRQELWVNIAVAILFPTEDCELIDRVRLGRTGKYLNRAVAIQVMVLGTFSFSFIM